MGIHFDDNAWHQYVDWQHLDRKTLKKINALLTSIRRNGYQSIGKVEKLKGDLSGFYSVRIDDKNRLVFYIRGDDIVSAAGAGHNGAQKLSPPGGGRPSPAAVCFTSPRRPAAAPDRTSAPPCSTPDAACPPSASATS